MDKQNDDAAKENDNWFNEQYGSHHMNLGGTLLIAENEDDDCADSCQSDEDSLDDDVEHDDPIKDLKKRKVEVDPLFDDHDVWPSHERTQSTIGSSRNWVFTLNNYTDDDLLMIRVACLSDPLLYLCYGKEMGANGTPHLQGFIYRKNVISRASIVKFLPRAYLAFANKPAIANIRYCKKQGNFTEFGTAPLTVKEKTVKGGEATKDKWLVIVKAAQANNLNVIAENEPQVYIQNYASLNRIAKDHMVKSTPLDNVCGYWIHGEAGKGKSHIARLLFPAAYDKMANKWWDGYQKEENVIIDDFDTSHAVLAHHLKIWGDKYSFIAESKGGAMNIRPKFICITSQYTPMQIWNDVATLEAIHRRFITVNVADWRSSANYVVFDPLPAQSVHSDVMFRWLKYKSERVAAGRFGAKTSPAHFSKDPNQHL